MRLTSFRLTTVFSVIAALVGCFVRPAAADEPKPIHALLVIGGCCHDYAKQKDILTEGISARANVEWTIVHEGDGSTTHKMSIYKDPDWAKGYDVVVHDECCADVKDRAFVEGILKPHRDGLPAVNLHCAMHCYRVSFDDFKDWFEFLGLESHAHGAQQPIALTFANPTHPITQGMTDWTTIPEELYNNIKVWNTATPLIYGRQGNDNDVVAWANDYHGTKVFSTTLGHNNETVGDARYLDLVTRGLLWSVGKLNADYLKPAKRVLADAPAAGPRKKVMAPINFALNKPATASGSQDGHEPGHAVDGDMDTRWCAPDNGNGYWWQVDLQKPEDLTGCQIYWEQEDQPYKYTVGGSEDGKTWKTLVDETHGGNRPQEDKHTFTASGVRYLRVTVATAPQGSWSSFFEFEAYGKTMVEKSAGASPDKRLAEVKIPAGFEKTLFAAPPDISYPTCISAPPSGEVFVGVDQNGSLDVAPNRGWVVRCLDTDGDGVADKFNIFAKMDSPRGLVFDHNTLYVMHPPVLEAFYDDNGTGTANRSEVLVRGLGHDLEFRGADHTCNGVRMGIDGWLYIALGDYGARKAVGKDGTELQLHGGGIVRVRPDGSDLEMVVQGTRNIYDVAIDPFMDIFTCDNTNDGDDWNVRLSHMIPTANMGYPSLFRHFSDEMIQTMEDYGGGAPTGSLFLDEPGFPKDFGYGLYTCQWGWSTVTRHPLKNAGASFTPGKESFIELSRPTGIDEDGEGHLYVASWKGATFTYAGPNAGYIVRVTPTGNKPTPFPNLAQTSDAQLLGYLASPSAVWRMNIAREILRRDHKDVFAPGLEKIALTDASPAVRVAAIFTLNQLLGADAHDALLRIAKNDSLRQYALKALADRKKDAANVPTTVFADALKDPNPAVRLQAVIALDRLDRRAAAAAILPLTVDSDISVAHVAFRALAAFHASDVCFQALDQSQTALFPGVMRVLRNIRDAKVVDGLITRLDTSEVPSPASRSMADALCRLYYREADWDGSWWGTRPDTSGPLFKKATWEESDKIGHELQKLVTKADDDSLRFLLTDFQANKIDPAEFGSSLTQIAAQKPKLRPMIIDMVAGEPAPSTASITFLQTVVLDKQTETALRTRAFKGLQNATEHPEAAASVLGTLSGEPDSAALAKSLRDGFVQDERHARGIGYFVKLADSDVPANSELAYSVLLHLAENKGTARRAKTTAEKAIDAGWKSARLASLLRAVGDTKAEGYTSQVHDYVNDTHADVAAAAAYAAAELGQTAAAPAAIRKNTVATLPYEKVVELASNATGNVKAGAKFFETLGCIKCHTTSKAEPLKGPFLGDITSRYKTPEILESILRPNAQIAQGFTTTTVETKDGTEFSGFVVRESGDDIELRNLAGATVIAKKDFAKRGTSALSIMPEGLADQLTPDDLASLLAFLKSLNPK